MFLSLFFVLEEILPRGQLQPSRHLSWVTEGRVPCLTSSVPRNTDEGYILEPQRLHWGTTGEHAATGPLHVTGVPLARQRGLTGSGGQLQVCPNLGRKGESGREPWGSSPEPRASSLIPSRIREVDHVPAPVCPRHKENLA